MKLTKEDIEKYATDEEKKILEAFDPAEKSDPSRDENHNVDQFETMKEDPRLQDEYDEDLKEFLKYAEAMGLYNIYDVDELYEAYMGWSEVHNGDDDEDRDEELYDDDYDEDFDYGEDDHRRLKPPKF